MKTVTVSAEVFAEIWKRHEPGDANEEDILRRVFELPHSPNVDQGSVSPVLTTGFEDARNGFSVPEGFEIFRVYKGKDFRARASAGKWHLVNDNKTYPSLHKLSLAVVNGHENSWYNWKYRTEGGSENFIHALRDQSKVITRS